MRINKHIFAPVLAFTLVFSNTPARAIDWGKIIVDSFETVGSDIKYIPAKTKGYSVNQWYNYSIGDVALVGAGACAIPGAHLAGMAAEFGYLMREVHNSALGSGHLIYGSIDENDFAIIFSVWAGETMPSQKTMNLMYKFASEIGKELSGQALEYAWEKYRKEGLAGIGLAAPSMTQTSAKTTSKVATKVIGQKVGVKAAGKISTKVAAKAGTKIAAKAGGKGISGWIPFVGPAVCAGVNTWIMKGVMDTADIYYRRKMIAQNSIK